MRQGSHGQDCCGGDHGAPARWQTGPQPAQDRRHLQSRQSSLPNRYPPGPHAICEKPGYASLQGHQCWPSCIGPVGRSPLPDRLYQVIGRAQGRNPCRRGNGNCLWKAGIRSRGDKCSTVKLRSCSICGARIPCGSFCSHGKEQNGWTERCWASGVVRARRRGGDTVAAAGVSWR